MSIVNPDDPFIAVYENAVSSRISIEQIEQDNPVVVVIAKADIPALIKLLETFVEGDR